MDKDQDLNMALNLDTINDDEMAVITDGTPVWFFTYLFMAFLIILNILSANQCVKDEKTFGPEQ